MLGPIEPHDRLRHYDGPTAVAISNGAPPRGGGSVRAAALRRAVIQECERARRSEEVAAGTQHRARRSRRRRSAPDSDGASRVIGMTTPSGGGSRDASRGGGRMPAARPLGAGGASTGIGNTCACDTGAGTRLATDLHAAALTGRYRRAIRQRRTMWPGSSRRTRRPACCRTGSLALQAFRCCRC